MGTGAVMLLICPSCATAFQVSDDALGADGRPVRCARCKTVWFAETAMSANEPAAETGRIGSVAEAPDIVIESTSTDIVVYDAPPIAPVGMEDAARDDIPLQEPAKPAAPTRPRKPAWHNLVWRGRARSAGAGSGLAITTLLLAGFVTAGLASPATFVRLVPDLAGLYAKAGVPVNLRGLEFREVRTLRETHDGIALLVTEGKIANISGQEIELPRVRVAVLGAGGQELYAWTTAASRERVGDGEIVPFRSRLASPPIEARQVQVRFLGRGDLAWSMQ
jgi:predicted Zn finger-like uncharacterized protein